MAKRKRSEMTSAQLQREREYDDRRKLRDTNGYIPSQPNPITLPKVSILEIKDWEIEHK